MGRSEWQQALQDEGVVTMQASRRAPRASAGLRLFGGLFVIGSLTFGGAFYLPLRSAHEGLRDEYQALAGKYAARGAELEAREKELASTREERDGLKQRETDAKTEADAQRARVTGLAGSLTKELAGLIGAKILEVSRKGEGVTVSFKETAVQDPKKLTLTRTGRASVCKAAGAAEGQAAALRVLTSTEESAWEDAATAAAAIGQLLQTRCGLKAAMAISAGATTETLSGPFELRFAAK